MAGNCPPTAVCWPCEVEQRLGLAERLATCIDDPRASERVRHGLADILRFRMLMIAAGYEDGNDADCLRHDPVFKLALDQLPDGAALCSQPTISRLENLPDLRALLRMARAMVGLYCASFRRVPRRIVLDVDDTFDAVHGEQQLRLFNAYYDEYGFQPIVVFDGEGRPVAAMLRPARRPGGAEARAVLRRLVRGIRGHWPRVEILIRADSHYCAPEVLDFCRAEGLDFVLGVAATSTLRRHVEALEQSTATRRAAMPGTDKLRRYKEFYDGADRHAGAAPDRRRHGRDRQDAHRRVRLRGWGHQRAPRHAAQSVHLPAQQVRPSIPPVRKAKGRSSRTPGSARRHDPVCRLAPGRRACSQPSATAASCPDPLRGRGAPPDACGQQPEHTQQHYALPRRAGLGWTRVAAAIRPRSHAHPTQRP